ncbi:MAG TPA: hypothetical protein VN519_10735, partial [Bryobacteraceae bacterium]|nr:hypothetical protein [Bryobacteraceae bacterium]
MAWKSVTFGSNAIAQNSQCTISGMGSSLTASGNTVTVNLSIIFRPAYAGMKTIFTDVNNSGQGYAEVGKYNVTPTAPDYTITVAPSSQDIQAGDTATYTVTVTPVNGFNEDITLSRTTYNSGGGDATGVSGALNPTVIPGGSGTSTLTVTSPPSIPTSTWQSAITGTAPSGTRVSNTVQTAVAAPPPPPPPALTAAVSPRNGSGGSQVFTFTFTDSNGSQDLINRFPHVIFGGSSTGSGNGGSYCWLGIYSTGFILAPDNLSMAWKGAVFGSSDVVQNSQCTVSGAGSSIAESGNTVTVNLAITFLPAYAGVKTIESDVNANGYTSIGTFNVTPTAPDFTISVAPSSQNIQAGQNATYTVTATPVNGFNQDITLSQTTFNSGGGDVTGVSGTLSPAVISGGSGTSTLTVTSPASTGTSTWQSRVTGTSPSITHVSNIVQTGVTGAPPPPPPTLTAAVSPQNGSGGSQVFTFTFTDSNGSQDFFTRTAHIIFSGTSTGSKNGEKYCWLLFGQTGAALAQDDLSQAWQFVTFGTNSVAQNSQCTINGAG